MRSSTSPGDVLRVLLVSPRTRTNRYSGEDAYTDALLAAPPEGVAYVHHEDLITAGRARRVRRLSRLVPRLCRLLRPQGPIWLESLATDERFDLVHIHGFSGYLGGTLARRKTPVLLSESSLDLENLVDYYGWQRPALRRFARQKRLILRVLGIYDQTLNLRDAGHLTVWSDWARGMHRAWGVPDERMSVIPPPVPDAGAPDARRGANNGAPHFLFVGAEFQRKNGPLVVEAFRRVRRQNPGARLTIVGERDADLNEPENNIAHFRHLPRERIVRDLYPAADALALPSRAEGYGVAVVEAMSAGLPAIVSGYGALPEIVGDTGIVVEPVTTEALAGALATTAAEAHVRGVAARARYEQIWSRPNTTGALANLYHRVLAERGA